MRAREKSSSPTVSAPVPLSMRDLMLPCSSAAVTAALSLAARLANRIFCAGVDSAIQAKAAAAIRPIISTMGSARRTAGWAMMSPIWRSGLAQRSGTNAVLLGVCALLFAFLRHAHDVLVGGQEFVADLHRRLEADRRLLAGEHDLGDVDRLAALVRGGEGGGALLAGIDGVVRVAERLGEARRRAGAGAAEAGGRGDAGSVAGAAQRLVAFEDLGAERHHPVDAHRAATDSVDAHAEATRLCACVMSSPCSRALA